MPQDDLNAAKSIIETRLVSQNINDYEVFTDLAANNIIVRFPWQADDTSFDPEEAVKEIGATAMLSFRMGYSGDLQEGQTYEDLELVLTGKDVDKAQVGRDTDSVSDSYFVHLQLNDRTLQPPPRKPAEESPSGWTMKRSALLQ